MNCRYCNSSDVNNIWRDDRQQYGTKCNSCNKYTWQPKKDSKKRESKHLKKVKEIGIDYCQFCLRNINEIPSPGYLCAHHIIEYKKGGTDNNDNFMILCSSCHSLCHHQRTYYGHYNIKTLTA